MFKALWIRNRFSRRFFARKTALAQAARAAVVDLPSAPATAAPAAVIPMEFLEDRLLFSQGVSLSNGILNITGSSTAACNLTVYLENSGTQIDASADNYHALTVSTSSVKGISITGGSGADYVFVDTGVTVPVTINGGDGNDQVRGGGGYNNIIEGNGSDWINARGTSNKITAGNGNDVILGANGNDTITAGDGNDSVDGGNGNDSITTGNGNDTITGDSGNDTLTAGNGTDIVNGGLGDDKITVGTGNSTVIPGSGINYVVLGNANATVVPSSGQNTVVTAGGSVVTSPVTGVANTASPTWVTYTAAAPITKTSPQAVMQVMAAAPVAGQAVDVRALNSILGAGTPIDAMYTWSFGDPTGEYNTLEGFNASHVYTHAGTFSITLTVENENRQTSTVYASITIAADNRKAIYVDSVHGSDSNSGLSQSAPLKTAAKADSLLTDNTEVFFERGETFDLSTTFLLNHTNLLVGAYGTGASPIIDYMTTGVGTTMFSTNSNKAVGVTIQDLTFTTLNGDLSNVSNPPMAIMAGGYGVSVLRDTFLACEYAVNGSPEPTGLTVDDSSSPTFTGLEGYFVWDEGTDTTVLGNSVQGSVHEHVLRTSSANEMLIAYNNFYNADGKGCIEIHNGAYAWIQGNMVNGGELRVGPLGLWGESPSSATNDCVITQNLVMNTQIMVYPGAHDISINNNIIRRNSSMMIDVIGQDSSGRQTSDIRIVNNTGYSTGTTGNFLQVVDHVDGIALENNLLIQPSLAVGGYNSAPVFVLEGNLSSFTTINGNVWQLPKTFYSTAGGGINLVGSTNSLSISAWNSQSVVGTDYFVNTSYDSTTLAPAANSTAATAGAPVAGVFFDKNGNALPSVGSWSAGAFQV